MLLFFTLRTAPLCSESGHKQPPGCPQPGNFQPPPQPPHRDTAATSPDFTPNLAVNTLKLPPWQLEGCSSRVEGRQTGRLLGVVPPRASHLRSPTTHPPQGATPLKRPARFSYITSGSQRLAGTSGGGALPAPLRSPGTRAHR